MPVFKFFVLMEINAREAWREAMLPEG